MKWAFSEKTTLKHDNDHPMCRVINLCQHRQVPVDLYLFYETLIPTVDLTNFFHINIIM